MVIPPVFCVDDLTATIADDLRDASESYCGGFAYTSAFDELFLAPEKRHVIEGFLDGRTPPILLADSLREWLLARWSSTRSLGANRMPAVGRALGAIRAGVAGIPRGVSLENADDKTIATMVDAFETLLGCHGVKATIASKLLAPLRPALFPMWDNPIATAYGFAPNPAGYRRYLCLTQAIARKERACCRENRKPAA